MQLEEWFKRYDAIRKRFGYSIVEDQSAAQFLSEMLDNRNIGLQIVRQKVENKNVVVFGAGPSLEESMDNDLKDFTVICADGASQALLEHNIRPDFVVTDLDGSHEHLLQADRMDSVIVVHAHGDNVNLMRNLVPKMKNCIGTTQVKPLHNIYNFGGFTDGDRAVFLASELKAKSITLVGMDFGEKIGKYSKTNVKNEKVKIEKMRVAVELLEWLATFSSSKLYNMSPSVIRGFKNISFEEIVKVI